MFDTVLFILFAIVLAIVVGVFLYLIFCAVDSWFRPRHQAPGQITGKDYTPPHTYHTYPVQDGSAIASQGGSAIVSHRSPERHWLAVQFAGYQASSCVPQKLWNECYSGTSVNVGYVIGR